MSMKVHNYFQQYESQNTEFGYEFTLAFVKFRASVHGTVKLGEATGFFFDSMHSLTVNKRHLNKALNKYPAGQYFVYQQYQQV